MSKEWERYQNSSRNKFGSGCSKMLLTCGQQPNLVFVSYHGAFLFFLAAESV